MDCGRFDDSFEGTELLLLIQKLLLLLLLTSLLAFDVFCWIIVPLDCERSSPSVATEPLGRGF
jgi:hypothetical protein